MIHDEFISFELFCPIQIKAMPTIHKQNIRFINCQEFLYSCSEFLKATFCKYLKSKNRFSAFPAAITHMQCKRKIVMIQCSNRFDTALLQFIQHLVIKLDTSWIYMLSIRKNSRPGKGEAKGFRSHLLQHLNILFIMMVKI